MRAQRRDAHGRGRPFCYRARRYEACADPAAKVACTVLPRTCVTVARAEELRALVVADLLATDACAAPLNGWDECVDESVYRQGGLRLVFSRKATPCGCAAQCTHPSRKVDAARPYLLHNVLDATGAEEPEWTRRLRANPVLCVLMSSIRVPGSDEECRKADEGPVAKRRRTGSLLPDSGSAGNAVGNTTSSLAPGTSSLAALVHGSLPPQHANLTVVSVTGGGARRLLRVQGEGDRYCPNAGRAHTQSTVCLCQRRGHRVPLPLQEEYVPAVQGRAAPPDGGGGAAVRLRLQAGAAARILVACIGIPNQRPDPRLRTWQDPSRPETKRE